MASPSSRTGPSASAGKRPKKPEPTKTGRLSTEIVKEAVAELKETLLEAEVGKLSAIEEQLEENDEAFNDMEDEIERLRKELETQRLINRALTGERSSARERVKKEEDDLQKRINEITFLKGTEMIGIDEAIDVKVAKPEDYDGSSAKLKSFFVQCEINFSAQTERFKTGKAKVLFALSYMNKGTALAWKEGVMAEQETLLKELAKLSEETKTGMWQSFKLFVQSIFQNLSAEVEARHQLMHLRQGTMRLEEYHTKFRLLSQEANLATTEGLMCFKAGLKWAIKGKIYDSGNIPNTLDDWVKRAKAIEMGWREAQADRAFSFERPPPGRVRTIESRREFNHSTRLSDDEFENRKKNRLCFKCGKPGHMSKACFAKNRTINSQEEEEPTESAQRNFQ